MNVREIAVQATAQTPRLAHIDYDVVLITKAVYASRLRNAASLGSIRHRVCHNARLTSSARGPRHPNEWCRYAALM